MNSTGACFLLKKKNVKGSGVRPWNNLFPQTEWIISRNEQCWPELQQTLNGPIHQLLKGRLPTKGIHSCIEDWLVLCPVAHCPSEGFGLAIVPPQWRAIAWKIKGLVKENFHQDFFSPWLRTWCHIFGGPGSRGGVCSVSLGSWSSSCPASKPVS